jgi:DNA-binding CsgD family transcriptional regulator
MSGQAESALAASMEAESATRATEVALLAATTRAVAIAEGGTDPDCASLFSAAHELKMWDPLLLGLRCSRALADAAARMDELRPTLASLYQRSRDLSLARRSGLRQRSLKPPSEVLSPRELEVLQLVAQGFRNREIAHALVISESTAKVHVRHVLEKLGVRTRAEAVARYHLFS